MTIQPKPQSSYARTTTAVQFDTFDSIAYRFFGSESNSYLPEIINLNPDYAPFAIIPMHAVIYLPRSQQTATTNTIKIWD